MPGPPPKPTELKRLAGNPGHRALPAGEPQPERVAPAMPRGLTKHGKRLWKAYAPKLEELGLLTAVDGLVFTMLVIHYDIAWSAAQTLKEDGLVLADINDIKRKHPLLQVLRDNSSIFLRYAQQFGLSPSARVRLATGQAEEVPDLAEAMAQIINNM